jgi:hypothetical protein
MAPLVAIFGYVVGDIGVHLLEKVWSISVSTSSGTGQRTVGHVAGQNKQTEQMEFLWTDGCGNEKKNA